MDESSEPTLRSVNDPKTGRSVTQCRCFPCGRWFQFGEHIYDGRRVAQYDIMICDWCDKANADGFTTENAAKIERHLRAKKLPVPARNSKGWLPLPRWGS